MIVAIHIKTSGSPERALDTIKIPEGWEVHSFIDSAKLILQSATGIPSERLSNTELMNSYLGKEWSYTKEERFVSKDEVERKPVRYYLSPKIMLAKIYELGRQVHSDFWVNTLLNKYTPEKKWVVLLVYPNEFAAVKELGAYTIFYDGFSSRGMLDSIKNQFDQCVNNHDAFEVLLQQKLK